MAIFFPTANNIRFMKALLMSDWEMGSGHASEAIAALSGFRSHAALLNALDRMPGHTVYEADFDAFEGRALGLGYDRNSIEYLRLIFTSLEWPEPVWRLLKKNEANARSAWFYECERRNVPFILVSKATKYYTVIWDHASMPLEYDVLVRQAQRGSLGQTLFRTYQSIARGREPKSFFEGSCVVGEVTGLSESSARQIANAFAMLLYPGNLQMENAA